MKIIFEENTDIEKHFVKKKELLEEIHKSKMYYCEFQDEKYCRWNEAYKSLEKIKNPSPDKVYRIMTNEHIPEEKKKTKRGRGYYRPLDALNFPPFKHYIWSVENGFVEVLRSHSKDGKYFSATKITERLGELFYILANKFVLRNNFRGYTYRQDMVADACLHLVQHGLKYDETQDSSPFAYYTTSLKNQFLKLLEREKKQREIITEYMKDKPYFTVGKQKIVMYQDEQ